MKYFDPFFGILLSRKPKIVYEWHAQKTKVSDKTKVFMHSVNKKFQVFADAKIQSKGSKMLP